MAEANPPYPFIKVGGCSCTNLPDEVGSEDMCEHGENYRAMETVATGHLIGAFNKGAEFRRTEKNNCRGIR